MEIASVAPPEIQSKAEALGWIPPTRYQGDPERYVDADEYLERGEKVMPILKAQNAKLQQELNSLRETSSKTAQALKQAQDAIEQIEERHSVETQKAVERARGELKKQLAVASAEGDHEGVAELTEQMTLLNKADAPEPAAKAAEPEQFTPPKDLAEWNADNPWFGKDKRKTALALGIAQEMREAGETLEGRPFYDMVAAEMDKMLGGTKAPATSKVEGARNGNDTDAPAVKGNKSYAALPKEAKDACDADSRQFVGPTKKYKSLVDWRNRYAEIYFEGA